MRTAERSGDPDFTLLQHSRTGNHDAFEELLSRHYRRVHSLVFRLIGGDSVDDVTQETFLLAYRNLHRFRGEANFSTWVTRIAVNQCRSEWRKRERRRETPLDNVAWEAAAEKARHKPSGGRRAMMETEKGEKIDREIAALPPKLRIAFTLRYIEGYSTGEVASILRCKEGTIRSRLFNARDILKVRLKELVQ